MERFPHDLFSQVPYMFLCSMRGKEGEALLVEGISDFSAREL